MMRAVTILLGCLPLSACISVYQTPLPDNSAVAIYYPKAASGDRPTDMVLAGSYQRGAGGVAANPAESVRRWLDQAEGGNQSAQMALGNHYQATDRDKSAYWYRRAADAGNRNALFSLTQLYTNARNGTPDYQTALKWAYAADNTYLANLYQKQLTPEAQA